MAKTGAVTLGEWIITYLLMLIPIVNLVLLVFWGFGGDANESKANWAKAKLILILVTSVLFLIMRNAMAGIIARMQ